MRKHYIDNLRSILILILIPYHAAMAWNVWEEPNYIFFDGNRIISSIVVFFSPFFMAALFMLAGISTCFALKNNCRSKANKIRTGKKHTDVAYLHGRTAASFVKQSAFRRRKKPCGISVSFPVGILLFLRRKHNKKNRKI